MTRVYRHRFLFGCVILVFLVFSLLLAGCTKTEADAGSIGSSEKSTSNDSSVKQIPAPPAPEEIIKTLRPPASPIPVEEWPPIPVPIYPAIPLDLPPPEISGSVVKIAWPKQLVISRYGVTQAWLLLFVEDPASLGASLAELKFDLRITFDPKVIGINAIRGSYVENIKLDKAQGIIELSVVPCRGGRALVSGWMDLGYFGFYAISNVEQSTKLHLTITSPVKNLSTIDGFVRVKPES